VSDNFILREANHSDFDALFPIYMDPTVNPFLSFEIMDKAEFKEIFNELFESGQMYVFENNRTIVSTCVVMRQKRRASHVVTLGTLATHPDFQGKGMGTRFMQALLKKLKADGIKRVDLMVEADNLAAQNFYKKIGFQLEGVLKQYFRRSHQDHYVDEHLMALLLA